MLPLCPQVLICNASIFISLKKILDFLLHFFSGPFIAQKEVASFLYICIAHEVFCTVDFLFIALWLGKINRCVVSFYEFIEICFVPPS